MDYTAYVTVTIPVGLAYDDDDTPTHELRKDAIANFLDHPAIKESLLTEDNAYVDNIRFESQCMDCLGRGWIVAQGTIQHCQRCQRFLSDAEALTYVAALARGEDETEAVILSSRLR